MTDPARTADRLQLRDLVEQYARGADDRDPELFAGAFTDDATLVTSMGEVHGREALLAIPPKLGRYEVTMHLVGNHYVSFADGDAGGDGPTTARGATYCVARHVYEQDGTRRVYVMHIRYDDDYRRTAAGWRIARRRLALLWDEDHPLRAP